MIRPRDKQSGWLPCPDGELSKAIHTLKSRRRDRSLLMVIGSAVSVVSIGLAAVFVAVPWEPIGQNNYGRVRCRQVRQMMVRYVTGQLNDEWNDKIGTHLKQCNRCRAAERKVMVEYDCPVSPAPRRIPVCEIESNDQGATTGHNPPTQPMTKGTK